MVRFVALLLLAACGLSAQEKVPQEFRYHHIWAVVPLIGTGKRGDPKRPMFVPSADERKKAIEAGQRPAVLSYTMVLSDDKRSAIVEFVGPTPDAMKPITQSQDPNVKTFDPRALTKDQIETELKRYKQNFSIEVMSGKATAAPAQTQVSGRAQ